MLDIEQLIYSFESHPLRNEDDVKLFAYADIFSSIQKVFAPNAHFYSEQTFVKGGRADGTLSNIVIEYKKFDHFKNKIGIDEALFGRVQKKNDSGLYQYIINSVDGDKINDSLLDTFGVGFDGRQWVIARFAAINYEKDIDLTRTRFNAIYGSNTLKVKYDFRYEIFDMASGIKQLILLFNSTNKKRLTKRNLVDTFNPANASISSAALTLHNIIKKELDNPSPQRTTTLYKEWDNTFGIMFGEVEQETEFNETSSAIRSLYKINQTEYIDSKLFLFATQTYFNIVLKLLIHGFIQQITNPAGFQNTSSSWSSYTSLFEGTDKISSFAVSNFFEIHFYEWFTYVLDNESKVKIIHIIDSVQELLNTFDLATYKIRPESIQDVLQEMYMTLIPEEFRHLLGEYFSPDWIVERAIKTVGYHGNLEETLIDPCCGSGAFVIQALKLAIEKNGPELSSECAEILTDSIVGFDLNPISAVSAKANYILTLLSSMNLDDKTFKPLTIPVYIADSVLSPVVYSESGVETFVAKTSVGEFEIPKFKNFSEASEFLNQLTDSIDKVRPFEVFNNLVLAHKEFSEKQIKAIEKTYEDLFVLHRSSQDSFWGKILKNSFAPVMLNKKFDFVVGNPPWIAWKSMSKTYRNGTLDVWISYGIFEKNAYDKKTTHDDFGMAVTYVSLDQYLKDNGKMYFLLPWTFLKSTKGGQGFRKLKITRHKQKVPVSISKVDDFNDIAIFQPKHTVRTIGVLFEKNKPMQYPMKDWIEWTYQPLKKTKHEAHLTWDTVMADLTSKTLSATPIDSSDLQSSWLTLPEEEIAKIKNVLLNGSKSAYRGRKGIEPAGAKGVYVLQAPIRNDDGTLTIINDMTRQRRKDLKDKGEQKGIVEERFVYPMLGGRNIARWQVKSCEYMLVPHTPDTPYGLDEKVLSKEAPETYLWLEYYKDGLLASRLQSGKFFNPKTQPWYRLDNVGTYTFSKYKVIWKEQASSFAAVAIGTASSIPAIDSSLFASDKPVVVDSKVLMLEVASMDEAYYVAGVLNSKLVRDVIDAYSVGLNRGTDVLANINIPAFDATNETHVDIAKKSKEIHNDVVTNANINELESELNALVHKLY